MFKLFGKLHSNKHGFTLVELMITIAVLSLVIILSVQLFSSIWGKYKLVEDRYIIQTELQYIVNAFQSDTTTSVLSSSTKVDLFYEDMDAARANGKFLSCEDDLGSFTDNLDGTLTFERTNTAYCYFINYNNYLYILPKNSKVATRFCFNDETQVNIEFNISYDAFIMTTETDGETTKRVEGETETYTDESNVAHNKNHKYVNGLTVTVKSGDIYLPNRYSLNTSFSFDNMSASDINVTGGYLTSQYVAGWTNGPTYDNYFTDDEKEDSVTYDSVNHTANIVRFISQSDAASGEIISGNLNAGSKFTICTTTWLMAGSNIEVGVENSLRDFRDNVLRGNKLGDLVIEKYYAWSPSVIEFASEHEFVRKTMKQAVVLIAYIVDKY